LWSLGVNTLLIGHLSVFSIMFLSLVIGVGIDYGIYFLYRFQEESALDAPIAEAMRRTADRTGPGMLLGALTAAGAFFVLVLTDFQGIREFGFVSGVSILLAFLSMLTLFPALLVLADRRRGGFVLPHCSEARWLVRLVRYRGTILIVAGALSAVGIWGVRAVTFDHNMLKLQAAGIESVVWEERILASSGRSGFTALSTAGSLDELRRKQDAFSILPSVSDVESVLMLVPDKQPEKERIIRQFAPLGAGVQVAAPAALEPAALRTPLLALRRRLALAGEGIADERMRANVQRLREKVERTLAGLDGEGAGVFDSLRRLQGQLHDDFV